MDGPNEPPKLPQKRTASSRVSKRVSYLMEKDQSQQGPVPLPRARKKSDNANLQLPPLPTKSTLPTIPTLATIPSLPTNFESALSNDQQPQTDHVTIACPQQKPTPAFRPTPKPRTKLRSQSPDFDHVDTGSGAKDSVSDSYVYASVNKQKNGVGMKGIEPPDQAYPIGKSEVEVEQNHTDIWAPDFSGENVFTEDPFKNNTSPVNNSNETSAEEEEETDVYIFPDTPLDKTIPSQSDTTGNNLVVGTNDNNRGETCDEPKTALPFDLKPFIKTIPFEEETSFIEDPDKSQPNASLRLSDLLDFDPLASRGTESRPSDFAHDNEAISGITGTLFSLNSSVPVPDRSHSQNQCPPTPGAYVSLEQMDSFDGQASKPISQPTAQSSTSLKHAPSFHFAAPEEPPPPLPRLPVSSKVDLVPPPVPPRPRPMNLSPMPSQRSSPSGSVGTLSDASVRSSPLPISDQTTSTSSAFLDDLPTPVFTPIDKDPFSDTGFGDFCHSFNKSYPLNTQIESSAGFGTAAAASWDGSATAYSAAAVDFTPSPAGPATAFTSGQDFEVDFDGAFGNAASPQVPFEDSVDPGRISRFVIPPPGSVALGKALFSGLHSDYDLAQELSSTDDSDCPDEQVDTERPMWTTPPAMPIEMTLISSSSLSQKKTTRYGYLYKQGGYNANKGWKKRWVVFEGDSLSYFDSNTAQISKRIVPVACMKDIATDIKPTERHGFKFKVVTSLKDRVFIFSAETLEDCLTWANSLMAAITEYKKSNRDRDVKTPAEKSEKEGFIRFKAMRRYFVVIRRHIMSYYQSFEDYEMGSPIHQMDMKLASVKVMDKKRYKLQLWLHYGHFDLTLESESEMQSWRMAIEDSIAEGLADDTVLEKVYQNLSNQQCADCGDQNPHWASINIGIVLCKNCAGIHRMFDYRISKVRSLRMDTRVWTPSLIELMLTIGNANANAFWESKLNADGKLQPRDTMDKRKDVISKKYLGKRFCNRHPLANERLLLGEELLRVASTDNVLEAMQVLFSGADILFRNDNGSTAYEIAKDLGQRLVMELLYQNGGDPQSQQDNVDDENRLREDVRLQGYLNKAGPAGKTFEKRWCILEHGTFTYYQNDKSPTAKGSIDRKHMQLLQKVNIDRPGFHFEISTDNKDLRTFVFSSDNEVDASEWMGTLAKLMSPVAIMEHVGMLDIKFAGYAYFKKSLQSEWRTTFLIFIWRGLYYMNQDLRLDYLDLRKATSIKLQDPEDGCPLAQEKGPWFVIGFTGMSVYVQSTLTRDTEKMFVALETAAKNSGTTLQDQLLTSENVPVIIDKCITHISKEGLQVEGIYRQSAQMSKVDNLLKEFRKDATAVTFSNCTVHEVANCMKKFLRELDDSVFQRINYPLWLNSSSVKDNDNRLMWFKYYSGKMSAINFSTLKRILLHLIQVARYQTSNQMTIQNLATCFAPTLMRTLKDESNFMSDVPSREINIIIDLLVNHEYVFQLNNEDEIRREETIRKAEMEIKKRLESDKETTQDSSSQPMLIPVHMNDPDGQAINISVTDDLKVKEAMEYFRKSKATAHINTSSFGMCELLFKGALVRPLLPDELLNCTIKRWMEWEAWVSKDNSISLCARETDLLQKLDEHTKASTPHILLSRLHYSDSQSKRFKRYTIGFRQCRLALYSNSKATNEIVSWPVENLIFYFGCSEKKAAPTKYCLTFLVEGDKCSKTQGVFGHCISFESEDEKFRWSSAFLLAQNPKGLLVWNTKL